MQVARVIRRAVLGLALGGAFALPGCLYEDDTPGFGPTDRVWVLTTLDGAPFTARATLTFPEAGRVAGEGPCNRFFGTLTSAYPAFTLDGVGSTKMACPDLAAEDVYFAALSAVTEAEATDDTLTLRSASGAAMVFTAAQ